MLTVKNLKKSYGFNTAVDNISFIVKDGEVFALLGPNGAGKTTTLKCILGLRKKNFGTVSFEGPVAYLPEEKSLYPSYRVEKLIAFAGELTEGLNVEKAISLVKEFNIDLQEKISNLSRGMITLLYLSLVFSQEANLYILDEPTWGLDPIMRSQALKLIKNLSQSGKTILYTSHILSEVETLADTIAIMKKGKIMEIGPKNELIKSYTLVRVEKGKKMKGYLWKRTETEDIYVLKRSEEYQSNEIPPLDAIFEAIVKGDEQ